MPFLRRDVEIYMRLALQLAKKAEGGTFPNPLVGAVIVKNGSIVGQGYHQKVGGPHAEIVALKRAGRLAAGGTLFCTFEPCCHYGRTGPCVEQIIKAKVKEVYAGMIDPNPLTRGRGVFLLKRAGIYVRVGFFEDEISRLNEPFVKAMTQGMPLVTVKIAQSLDGKTATKTGASKWITGVESRAYSHDARRFYDAIMVGINTVLKDDPLLDPSPRFKAHALTKIIVDTDLRIPFCARAFSLRQSVIVACVRKDLTKTKKLEKMGVRVITTSPCKGRVDLKELLKKLNDCEIRNVLVEGGADLIGTFLDRKLADRALVFIAPKIIGGKDAQSSVGGEGVAMPDQAIAMNSLKIQKLGADFLIEGSLKYRS